MDIIKGQIFPFSDHWKTLLRHKRDSGQKRKMVRRKKKRGGEDARMR